MVAFGVAPAIVTYQWGVERIAEYGARWGRFGWLAAFFYAVCRGAAPGALQRARGHRGQALLRRPAEPVGRRHRRGLHLVLERAGASRGLPG